MSSQSRFPDWYDPDPNEEPRVVTHPHVVVYWKGFLTGLLLIAAGIGVVVSGRLTPYLTDMQIYKVSGGLGLFGVLIILYEYMEYVTTWYLVTTHYIVKRDGIFRNYRRKEDPLHLETVQDWNKSQSLVQLAFGTGDIEIYSSGTSDVDIVFRDIPAAKKVIDIIKSLTNEHRTQPRDPIGEEADSDATSDGSNGE